MKNCLMLIILLSGFSKLQGQSPDRRAVYDAAMDYIQAMYKSEPSRIERSVYPEVVRRGYYWRGLDSAYSDLRTMNYDQIIQWAKDWNKSLWLPADAPLKVDVYDVQDKTAAAKITAYWGTEYLQLAKLDKQWKIMNILWQSPPQVKTY